MRKHLVRAAALASLILSPDAEAAHCRSGKVYIIHAGRCVGERSRLARLYVWGAQIRHLRTEHWGRRAIVSAPQTRLQYVTVRDAPAERPAPALEQAAEPDIAIPWHIEHSLLERAPTVFWRLP